MFKNIHTKEAFDKMEPSLHCLREPLGVGSTPCRPLCTLRGGVPSGGRAACTGAPAASLPEGKGLTRPVQDGDLLRGELVFAPHSDEQGAASPAGTRAGRVSRHADSRAGLGVL